MAQTGRADLQRGADRPLDVIAVGNWCSEAGDGTVGEVLLHGAAIARDNAGHHFLEPLEKQSRPLRIGLVVGHRRLDQLTGEDRHRTDLVFGLVRVGGRFGRRRRRCFGDQAVIADCILRR